MSILCPLCCKLIRHKEIWTLTQGEYPEFSYFPSHLTRRYTLLLLFGVGYIGLPKNSFPNIFPLLFKLGLGLFNNSNGRIPIFPDQHKGIERISVQVLCFTDKAIIAWVMHLGKEPSIELHPLFSLIIFIFIPAPLRNFDHDTDNHLDLL